MVTIEGALAALFRNQSTREILSSKRLSFPESTLTSSPSNRVLSCSLSRPPRHAAGLRQTASDSSRGSYICKDPGRGTRTFSRGDISLQQQVYTQAAHWTYSLVIDHSNIISSRRIRWRLWGSYQEERKERKYRRHPHWRAYLQKFCAGSWRPS